MTTFDPETFKLPPQAEPIPVPREAWENIDTQAGNPADLGALERLGQNPEDEGMPEGYSADIEIPELPEWPFDGPIPPEFYDTVVAGAEEFQETYNLAARMIGDVVTETAVDAEVYQRTAVIRRQEVSTDVEGYIVDNIESARTLITSLQVQVEALEAQLNLTKKQEIGDEQEIAKAAQEWKMSVEKAAANMHRIMSGYQHELQQHIQDRDEAYNTVLEKIKEEVATEPKLEAEKARLETFKARLEVIEGQIKSINDETEKLKAEEMAERIKVVNKRLAPPEDEDGEDSTENHVDPFAAENSIEDEEERKAAIKQSVARMRAEVDTTETARLKGLITAQEARIGAYDKVLTSNTRNVSLTEAEIARLEKLLPEIREARDEAHRRFRYEVSVVMPRLDAKREIAMKVAKIFEPVRRGEVPVPTGKIGAEWNLSGVARKTRELQDVSARINTDAKTRREVIDSSRLSADMLVEVLNSSGMPFDTSAVEHGYKPPQESTPDTPEAKAEPTLRERAKEFGMKVLTFLDIAPEPKSKETNEPESTTRAITQG